MSGQKDLGWKKESTMNFLIWTKSCIAAVLMLILVGCDNADIVEDVDYTAAYNNWRSLAEQGNMKAQHNLGVMYHKGQGVPVDYAKAMKWYLKAAEQGFDDAQYNIGIMYDDGNGVKQDYVEAVRWYRKAAEQGDIQAQNNLGYMYYHGHGVQQDYVEAYKWANLAAINGHTNAAESINIIAKKMTPEQISNAKRQAQEWMDKSGY